MSAARFVSGATSRVIGIACVSAAVSGCAPPLTPSEQVTLDLYLVCYECVEPLQAVRTLAVSAPKATVESLNVALRGGPSAARAAESTTLLRAGYTRDSSWRAANARPPLAPRDAHVALKYEHFANGYRERGAIALGWIRGARALRHLDAAIADSQLPASVRAAAQFARDSLPQANPPLPP